MPGVLKSAREVIKLCSSPATSNSIQLEWICSISRTASSVSLSIHPDMDSRCAYRPARPTREQTSGKILLLVTRRQPFPWDYLRWRRCAYDSDGPLIVRRSPLPGAPSSHVSKGLYSQSSGFHWLST